MIELFPSNFTSTTLSLSANVFQSFIPFIQLLISIGVVLLIISFILNLLTK